MLVLHEILLPSSGIQAAKDSGVGSALPMLALHIRMAKSSPRELMVFVVGPSSYF